MNRLQILAAALLAAFLVAPTAHAQANDDYRQMYAEGIKAYNQGDYATAIQYFEVVRQKYPRDARLLAYLKKAQANMRAGVPRATMEAKLQSIVIPNFEVEQADLDSIFEYLRQKVVELSGGQTSVNFIYKGTPEQKADARVTLKLSNVPLTELLRYIGEMSGTQFKYETHAVVGIPRSSIPVPDSEPATKDPFDPFA